MRWEPAGQYVNPLPINFRIGFDKLKEIQAAEGTLLDHSVLLLGGAQISSHSGKSFPTLVRFAQERKPMSDLYLTILPQLGCPVRSFKESAGPIGEVLA